MKFAENGSLLDYLKKQRSHEYENVDNKETVPPLAYKQKLKFALEIAKGMDHLSSKKVWIP